MCWISPDLTQLSLNPGANLYLFMFFQTIDYIYISKTLQKDISTPFYPFNIFKDML